MWRWLHNLPRVVRQQFHSPGASAGICVEDLHESELSKRETRDHKAWVYHCRYQNEKGDGKEEKKGPNPENIDFWKLLHSRHSAFEAIRLSGAIALCVELTHYQYIGKFHRTQEEPGDKGCLLKKIVSSLHKYGIIRVCPDNRLHLGDTTHTGPASIDAKVEKCDQEQAEEKSANRKVQLPDPNPLFASINPLPKSFSEEKGFTFYDFQTRAYPNKADTSTKQKPDPKAAVNVQENDIQVPVPSIKEAFSEFEEICRIYTSIGKGIMGNQAAMSGNMKSAVTLWEEATTLGHSKSCFNMALCYEQGKGVKKNLPEAVRLYKLAVKENHAPAMYNLAMLYMDGTEQTPQNTTEAIRLITAAAHLGLIQAQRYLGVFYSEEHSEDPDKAVHFLKMAADQQDPEAQYYLAMFYENGYGVEKNVCKAAYLYNKAAESKHPDALYCLALYHLDGMGGLPQDQHCAKSLLKKSADLGNKQATEKLEELEKVAATVIKSDADMTHTRVKKSQADLTYLIKLNTSVSTPCLSDLVCNSVKELKDKITHDPLSNAGTVSQIFTDMMVPRGISLTPVMTKLSETSESSVEDGDSDSGVVFTIGKFVDNTNYNTDLKDNDVRFEYHDDHLKSHFSHSASMPDMFVMACT